MTGRPFSGYLSVLDGTRTDNILRTRLPMEYQSFRGCDTFSRIRDSDVKGAFTGRGVMMKYIDSVYTIKSKLPFGDESRAKIVVEEASTIYMSKCIASGVSIRGNARWMLCSVILEVFWKL